MFKQCDSTRETGETAKHQLCALYEKLGEPQTFHVNQPADSVSAKQPAGFATLKIKGFQKDFLNQMLQKSHNVKKWKIKNEGS